MNRPGPSCRGRGSPEYEAWSFDHFDTMTVMVADAPRPDEIVLCMAVANGGRPHPRCGDKPITD
ncbi:MAG: amino acid synthesis family protein [Alphaproteobacteria bacterium]